VNVCDWTRARGREKFAFPRLSTATDEKKSHTRGVDLIYKLTYIVIMIINNNNNNNNNNRRLTMFVAMLVDWRFFPQPRPPVAAVVTHRWVVRHISFRHTEINPNRSDSSLSLPSSHPVYYYY